MKPNEVRATGCTKIVVLFAILAAVLCQFCKQSQPPPQRRPAIEDFLNSDKNCVTFEYTFPISLTAKDSSLGYNFSYLHLWVEKDTVRRYVVAKGVSYNQKLYKGATLRKAKFR